MKDRLFIKENPKPNITCEAFPKYVVAEGMDTLVNFEESEIGEYVLIRKHLCRRESRVISREIP